MKKILFLIIFVTVLFTAALFAEGEMSEAVPQQDAASSEEAKPEENKEEQQSGGVTVTEKEISGKNIVNTDIKKVFSERSTEKMTWDEAVKYCDRFTDFHFGEKWRLPTVDELRELMRNCPATEPGGSCKVSDEENCLAGNCSSPKNSCACERKPKNRGYYSMYGDADYIGLWSSSTLSDDDKKAWGAVFYSGMIGSVGKDVKLYARCIHIKDNAKKENEPKKKRLEPAMERELLNQNDIIRKLIREKNKEFSQCINKGAREDRTLSHGMLFIEVMISTDGNVAFSNVLMSTAGNLTIENCIAEKIKEIKFPAPKHGAVVITTHYIPFRIPGR